MDNTINANVPVLDNNTINVNESMVATAKDKLIKSSGCESLDALVNARTRRSLLLVDTSGSMNDRIRTGETKIDALRNIVNVLVESHPVPVAAFGGSRVTLVSGNEIPNPSGNTPMSSAINYAKLQGANHAVLVTDGASSEYDVLDVARAFGGPIDTFFVGNKDEFGFETARDIAKITGGQFNLADLTAPKQLGAKIAGFLGDGSF